MTALVEYDADEILARMRDDEESDWPHRLLWDIRRAEAGRLSPLERRVLELASHGMAAAETAALLDSSESAVREHLKIVRRKLAAKNTCHAVALALRAGLIV